MLQSARVLYRPQLYRNSYTGRHKFRNSKQIQRTAHEHRTVRTARPPRPALTAVSLGAHNFKLFNLINPEPPSPTPNHYHK